MMNTQDTERLIDISNHLFVDTSIFTKNLGLAVVSMDMEHASMRFHSDPSLTGSERTLNLHGGVIASVVDITGSLVVFSNLIYRMKSGSLDERITRVTRINTIDLRIDYIRPGFGSEFRVIARILRTGRTVAVSRVELRNEKDDLLAIGTASYILSVKS